MQINIKGILQGVSFRPFIYILAKNYDLLGYVLNDTIGVSIDVEGYREAIEGFINSVKTQSPLMAEIFDMQSQCVEPFGYEDFTIRESEDQEEKLLPISLELATCEDCLYELFNPVESRYRYSFINYTNCGPRFYHSKK